MGRFQAYGTGKRIHPRKSLQGPPRSVAHVLNCVGGTWRRPKVDCSVGAHETGWHNHHTQSPTQGAHHRQGRRQLAGGCTSAGQHCPPRGSRPGWRSVTMFSGRVACDSSETNEGQNCAQDAEQTRNCRRPTLLCDVWKDVQHHALHGQFVQSINQSIEFVSSLTVMFFWFPIQVNNLCRQRMRWKGVLPRSGLFKKKDGYCGFKNRPPKPLKVFDMKRKEESAKVFQPIHMLVDWLIGQSIDQLLLIRILNYMNLIISASDLTSEKRPFDCDLLLVVNESNKWQIVWF